ncbi:hypothetical protein [Citreimonas salinaria]|uniref:Uncharacterized protein n=1 Tax=Citreimonas salinaria TaxID=321339 RepID=A0A1H3HSF9_9RHOB|nr:hypothetical protein [Citreimonas salinaria]SDY18407.1 hypothetical protein SAMN05444340_104139 [Citreimonas salinaria]
MNMHRPPIRQEELERLVFHMPVVAESASTGWAKSFALSIVRQSRRRGWRPSPKQLHIMRDLVSDLFAYGADHGEDLSVIE